MKHTRRIRAIGWFSFSLLVFCNAAGVSRLSATVASPGLASTPSKVMILKTYTRVFTHDLKASLPLYQQLVGREPDFHVTYGKLEVAALGNYLIIAGPAEAFTRPILDSHGTIVVDNLEAVQHLLEEDGAVITQPLTQGPTGTSVHARHPDGNTFEYVQWKPEFSRRITK